MTNESQLSNAITNAQAGDTINITRSFTLTQNLPTIVVDLTINGNGKTLTGGTDIRIFTVDGFTNPVNITIHNLKMKKGACNSLCPINGRSGGAIYNDSGTLTISSSTFMENFADDAGGGLYNNNGTVTLTNSTFSGNSAAYAAGGFYNSFGWVTISNSTFSGNHADYGGGIHNGGPLTINNSTLSGNWATTSGGGISSTWDITITDSTLSDNSAPQSGGVDNNGTTLTITNSTLSGNHATSGNGGGIYNYTSGIVLLTSSRLSGNSATSGNGGGLYNDDGTVTLSNSTLSSNSATGGAGIYSFFGTVTINNSTLSSNSATGLGGAILTFNSVDISNSIVSSNSATAGGGIYNTNAMVILTSSTFSTNVATNGNGGGIDNNNGTLTISSSTFSTNVATNGNGGGIDNNGTMTLSNSTLSSNAATNAGGGIANLGTLTITNSTFSTNEAGGSGGGIFNFGTLTFNNTLLHKGKLGTNCSGFINNINSNGTNYNLDDDGSCGGWVRMFSLLSLGTLGANGGPTKTVPLLVGSPAVDSALAADCPATDQRGVARPVGADCDIGAFEGAVIPATAPIAVEPTAIPAPALCSLTGFGASAQVAIYLPNGGNGLNVCYSLISDPAQVGITQPFIAAVEVYSFDASGSVTAGVPVQVCLQGVGQLLYRDANGQPRITVNLPSFSQNGFTCGTIPHPGTVILIPGAPSPAAAAPILSLNQCRMTTTNILNLRAAPDATSTVLDLVPYQMVLSASARSGEWLQVVFGAQQGWLSAAYLTFEGGCG